MTLSISCMSLGKRNLCHHIKTLVHKTYATQAKKHQLVSTARAPGLNIKKQTPSSCIIYLIFIRLNGYTTFLKHNFMHINTLYRMFPAGFYHIIKILLPFRIIFC